MLTYSEWKDAEKRGIVQYVSEPYLRARRWHVLVLKLSMFCSEFELDDEREGLAVYLQELRQQGTEKKTKKDARKPEPVAVPVS